MNKNLKALAMMTVLALAHIPISHAQLSSFKAGQAITEFGKYADVATSSVDKNATFKIAFDVAQGADVGKINRKFDSLARFINMHVAAGVAQENISLALVVHGKAAFDLLNNETYHIRKSNEASDNANIPLLQALLKHKVRVILCGQTAAAHQISLAQLVTGAEIELSAMTAHALLQQQGYTVNPF